MLVPWRPTADTRGDRRLHVSRLREARRPGDTCAYSGLWDKEDPWAGRTQTFCPGKPAYPFLGERHYLNLPSCYKQTCSLFQKETPSLPSKHPLREPRSSSSGFYVHDAHQCESTMESSLPPIFTPCLHCVLGKFSQEHSNLAFWSIFFNTGWETRPAVCLTQHSAETTTNRTLSRTKPTLTMLLRPGSRQLNKSHKPLKFSFENQTDLDF